MSNLATVAAPKAAESVKVSAPDFSQLVVRPKKGALKLFKEVFDHGGPGYLQFAITNTCNADCSFYGFARSQFNSKARCSVPLDEAKRVIDITVKNHIGYLLFVGGSLRSACDDALRGGTRHSSNDLYERQFVE